MSSRGSIQAISPYCSGLSGLTAHRPGFSFCCVMASADSVTKTSARFASSSSKIVTFSPCSVSLACLKLARAKRSLLPPGLKITRTSGLSMAATLWYLATSAQRAIGVLPLTM